MKQTNLLKVLSHSSVVLASLFLVQHAYADDVTDKAKDSQLKASSEMNQTRVDPNSPEYIEVSTEAEFRDAVESDNGKTFIKLTSDIKLLEGQVVVPSSKTNLTIDGSYETDYGGIKRYVLQSGYPKISDLTDLIDPNLPIPPQVTDVSKQKMLYVNNTTTKQITITNVDTITKFLDGVVYIDNKEDDVTVTLDNTNVFGPMGVVNQNGVVNILGSSQVVLCDTYNDIAVIRGKGLAEANIINIFGEISAKDFNGDVPADKTLFRMYGSNGYSPHLTIMPTGKISGDEDMSKGILNQDKLQTLVWSDSVNWPTALTMMSGSQIDIKLLSTFNNRWGLSNVIIEDGAILNIERSSGEHVPNRKSYSTITVTKGFLAKKGSSIKILNAPQASITGQIISVDKGGVIDINEPKKFDILGSQTVSLFSYPNGAGLLDISATNELKGWTDTSLDNPTQNIAGPLEVQYSFEDTKGVLISATLNKFDEMYPINNLHRMIVE
ncbi:hypothetical protein EFE32_10660 [Lactococcus lactis subsp. lactis]|uniref:hypothetical protein n=1 Tax=Lactococcus lactis TaxID=1358 RepID=UPI00223B05C5|nr:hypothetical protein [Lactococcus lactis]MCT0017267.1 hypothetical protein [Lactococcus lactis subsp. lactis]